MRALCTSTLLAITLGACSSSSGGSSSPDDADAIDVDSTVTIDPDGLLEDTTGEDADQTDAARDASTDAPAGSLLPGTAAEDGWAAIPEIELPAPDPADIVSDEALGMVANRLALWLAEDATVGDVNGALAAFELTIIGGEPALGWLVAEVDPDDLEAAVTAADESEAFEVVNLDLIYPAQVIAPHHGAPEGLDGGGDWDTWEWETLGAGANWGLKFIGAPAAWNLRPLMHGAWDDGPRAVVIDISFPDHPDVSFAEGSTIGALTDNPHGTAVATVMAAHWDEVGIEGVFPSALWLDEEQQSMEVLGLRATSSMGNVQSMTAALLGAALDEVPLVANQSLGTNYFSGNRDDGFELKDPDDYADWSFNTYRELNARDGRAWRAFARRSDVNLGFSDWLFVCSAGNSNVDAYVAERTDLEARRFTAEENSGCGWAATAGGASHFIVVENLGVPGNVLDHVSHRDGTLAAPGNSIGQASSNRGYRAEGGTSFASPMVAGSALVLWSLEPDATHRQIRDALVNSALEAVEDSAPRLNLWGAILELDRLDEEPDLIRYVTDLDDGTVDGALRVTPEGVVNTTIPEAGDGCIDVADFRALRDAILDGRSIATWSTALDGDKEHPKRDLNRDGGFNYTVSSDVETPEGYFARHDLNGDNKLDDSDMRVLAGHWGTCWGGSGPAATQGLTAVELESLIASVDVWVDLTDADPITVTATGSSPVTLRSDRDELVEGYAEVTVAYDSCGDFVVRTSAVDGSGVTHRQWQPEGDVEAGNDLILGEGSSADIDKSVPLAFVQAAGGVSWVLLYDGDSPARIDDRAEEILVSPDGVLAFEGDEAIEFETPSRSWEIDIDGTSDKFLPWQWAPSGQALLAINITSIDFDDDHYAYVDLEREQGWILDTEFASIGDWPTIDNNGVIWMSGRDGHIHTITPPPVGIPDWDTFIDELIGELEPTCSADAAGGISVPEAVQFDSVSGYSRIRLAFAEPTSVSSTGFVAAVGINGDDTDLIILSPDGTQATIIKENWTPRGANDTGYLGQRPDYVTWSSTGQYLAFGETDGIHVANLGTSYWEFPNAEDITVARATERLGAIAFAPLDDRFFVVEHFGPPAAPEADLTVVTVSGTEVVTYDHGPRYGFPGWSGMGAQIVVTEYQDTLTAPDIKVVSAYRDEVFFETTEWRSESGGRSNERIPSWGRTIRGF